MVSADLDMKGFAIKNTKVIPANDASATSRKYIDRKIGTKADKTSLASYFKKDSPEVAADLDMKGFAIKNMKLTPGNDTSATSRKYVDGKLNTKADKNDLNNYLKLDGTSEVRSYNNVCSRTKFLYSPIQNPCHFSVIYLHIPFPCLTSHFYNYFGVLKK